MSENNTNALVKIEPGTVEYLMSMATIPKHQIRREIDKNFLTILKQNNPNLPDVYFIDFLFKCQITGADPRLNQVYLISHNTKDGVKGSTIFAYLFFVQMAQRTGQLEDWGVECIDDVYTEIGTGRKKPSYTSTCWVKRKGQAKIVYTCYFWEMAKLYNGNPSATWASSPKLMLNKCAVASAFRWAFPETLGSFYVQEEIRDAVDVEYTVVPKLDVKVTKDPDTEKPTLTIVENTDNVEVETKEDLTINNVEATEFERDIEDYRSELIEYISTADTNLFEKLGKDRAYMLDKVENTKTLSSMKTIYEVVIKA